MPMLLAASFTTGCGDRQADEVRNYEETCKKHCAQVFDCDPNPASPSEEQCVSSCSSPDDWLWEKKGCNDAADAMLICVSELSCQQYVIHHENLQSSPCMDVTYDFSVCIATNGDD